MSHSQQVGLRCSWWSSTHVAGRDRVQLPYQIAAALRGRPAFSAHAAQVWQGMPIAVALGAWALACCLFLFCSEYRMPRRSIKLPSPLFFGSGAPAHVCMFLSTYVLLFSCIVWHNQFNCLCISSTYYFARCACPAHDSVSALCGQGRSSFGSSSLQQCVCFQVWRAQHPLFGP